MNTLGSKTVKHLRKVADGLGITYAEAKKAAGGKTPSKETWVALIEAHPKYKAPKAPKGKAKAPEVPKAPKEEPKRVKFKVPETKNPADLCRKALLAGVPDFQIREIVAEAYPDYGALAICVTVYRRELKRKGELK